MKHRALLLCALLSLTFAACDEGGDRPPDPEQLAFREAAWRQACAARALEEIARSDIETLEAAMTAFDPADPVAEISRMAAGAALEFGRAFHRHAELRNRAYAHLDSAVNVARTPADSATYIERAGAFSIRAPDPGSVEANVIADYEQRIAAILGDEDHRCTWDTPFD
jgi:hypothetical protein